jgi:hypothetical protein
MNEELILQALDSIGQALNLCFQVIIQTPYIHIYINRDLETNIDYTVLTNDISHSIAALEIPQLQGLYLYSRFLGLIEPDWETFVDFNLDSSSSTTEAEIIEDEEVPEAIAPSIDLPVSSQIEESTQIADEIEEIENFDLSRYCFIRNKLLLTAELQPPASEITELIVLFHAFSEEDKQQIIPDLESFLTTSTRSPNTGLSTEIQKWFEQLFKLDSTQIRKAAIWFSRYCFDTSETVNMLTEEASNRGSINSNVTEVETNNIQQGMKIFPLLTLINLKKPILIFQEWMNLPKISKIQQK